MVTSPKGIGPEKDYAVENQQHIKRQTHPVVREDAPKKKTITVKK
jgi:hypothetical protein